MRRCFWKDCSNEPVGALTHTYAPEGLVWYCAMHAPNSDHAADQTLRALTKHAERTAGALERIASALERSK